MAKLPRLGIITPSPRYIEQVTCLYGKPEKESKYQEIRIAAVLRVEPRIRGENFKKKAKYVEQDRRLANIVEEYSTREPLSYLKAISYHLTF